MDPKLYNIIRVFNPGTVFRTTVGVFRLERFLPDSGMEISQRNQPGEWNQVSVSKVQGEFLRIGL